ERAVKNLQRIGSNDQDYQVRFAAIEALESIGIKEPKAANVALLALDHIRQVHQLKPGSAMIQDLAKAAITASVVVQKALKEKPPPSLPFDVGDLGRTEVGRNTKTKVLNQLATQLNRSGVTPSENDYVISVVRSIIRRSNVVRMRKSQGVT